MQFMQLLVFFAMLPFLAAPMKPVVPSLREKQGCCGSIWLLGYERTFFAVYSLCRGSVKTGAKDAK